MGEKLAVIFSCEGSGQQQASTVVYKKKDDWNRCSSGGNEMETRQLICPTHRHVRAMLSAGNTVQTRTTSLSCAKTIIARTNDGDIRC